MRVLCVAAHPDDEILGVGGTLLRHKDAGDEVEVWLNHECRPESTEESYEAAKRMDLRYVLTPYQDLDYAMRGHKPDIVYTHHGGDLHADHREVHERVLVACRPQSGVKAIYAFETPSATEWGLAPFHPTRFVDIGQQLERKLHAMGAYESELRTYPHPRNLKSLTARSQSWGQHAGVVHAEAFTVIREIW